MAETSTYRGVTVKTVDPTEDAGLSWQNNFKALADRLGNHIEASDDPTSNDDSAGTGGEDAVMTLSTWRNTSDDSFWLCLNASVGAASWVRLTMVSGTYEPAFGAGTIATQDADSVVITGGSIGSTTITLGDNQKIAIGDAGDADSYLDFDGSKLNIWSGYQLAINSDQQLLCQSSSAVKFYAGVGADVWFAAGGLFKWADRDDGYAVRSVLDPATGAMGLGVESPDFMLDVNGTFGFAPGSSVTPVDDGDVVFELTDDTTFKVKAKGSDTTVRYATIPLSDATVLTTETDPIVGAINGIVKANGAGTIAAAVSGTDYEAAGTASSLVASHESDTTAIHGIANTASLLDTSDIGASVLAPDGDGSGLSGVVTTETDPIVGAISGIVKANGAGTIAAAVAGTDYMAAKTIGIADDNLVEMDDADAASGQYARFTANGIEGITLAALKTALGLDTAPTQVTDDDGAETWDWSATNNYEITLDHTQTPCSITFSNVPANSSGYRLVLIQDATGGTTPSITNTIYWAGGVAPTWETGASTRMYCTFWSSDSIIYGAAYNYAVP